MKTTLHRLASAGILVATLFQATGAQAQLGDLLDKAKGAAGSGANSGGASPLGDLGGALSGQSMTAGSTGNVAGILTFCIKNNYLKGNAASGVKDALMGKLGGSPAKSDSGYSDGARGVLNSAGGGKVDLGGGGLKAEVTRKVCDTVLSQAKSLL